MPVSLRRFFLNEIHKAVKKQSGEDGAAERPLTADEKAIMRAKMSNVNPEMHRNPYFNKTSENSKNSDVSTSISVPSKMLNFRRGK